MKKIISVILVALSFTATALSAYATDENTPDAYATQYETPDTYESIVDTVNPDTFTADSDTVMTEAAEAGEDSILTDIPVAIMYLCVSGPHSKYVFGHTWICIKNISDEKLTVGSKIIEPGKMSSFGLHHFDGMHYDDEMYDYNGETVKTREKRLTRSELKTAADEITDRNWHWYEYFAHNCTNFATSVWKETTGQHYFAFCFPFIVQIQMAVSGMKSLTIK